MPAALTAIRTSPRPTGGAGRSCTWRSVGGAGPLLNLEDLGRPVLSDDDGAHRKDPTWRAPQCRAGSEVDRAAAVKAVELEDLLEELVGHRGIGGECQD